MAAESTPLLQNGAENGTSHQKPQIPRASFSEFFREMIGVTLIAFGGPHVGLLHNKFVVEEREQLEYYKKHGNPKVALADGTFLELYALCQSLPGSGSAQFAAALGAIFGGFWGSIATVTLWHIIGIIVMSIAGVAFNGIAGEGPEAAAAVKELTSYTVGLVSAAFALVLLAANKITRKAVGPDRLRTAICIMTASTAVMSRPQDASWVYGLLLVSGGTASLLQREYYKSIGARLSSGNLDPMDELETGDTDKESMVEATFDEDDDDEEVEVWDCRIHPDLGARLLFIYFAGTVLCILLKPDFMPLKLMTIFWVAGACTFGGGIVVIPLLLSQIVDSGYLPSSTFLVGFGLFGCVPGPMFNLASFLGGAIDGWRGAAIATVAMLSPGIIILLGVLPFWQKIRQEAAVRAFVRGVNAVAAGLILAGVWMLMKKALVGPAAYALTLSSCAGFIVYDSPAPLNIIVHGIAGVLLKSSGIGGPFSK